MFIVKKGEGSLLSRTVREAVSRLLARYDGTPFELRFWDGDRLRIGAGPAAFAVTFRTRGALVDTLVRRSLGLGEAYARHEVLFDGDLEDALTGLGHLAQRASDLLSWTDLSRAPAGALGLVGLEVLSRSAARERAAVAHHDGRHGEDFDRLYLDRRLQHSCGYFRAPTDTLDEAQAQKIALLGKKLALRDGQRLLDVGCGWGHLMFHAAETYGAQCLGITLCERQARYIREQAAARRLPVEVRVMSVDDLDPEVRWDRVVSVETMGQLGEDRIERFYDKVKAVLAPRAICVLQSVTKVRESSAADPFVAKHIFPGYWLPSLQGMTARAAARGLDVLDVESQRRHCVLTTRHWRRNFLQNYERIKRVTGYDDRFLRTWEFYLAYASAAFRTGHLSLVQMVMANGLSRDYPLTREPLYAAEEPASRERPLVSAAAHPSRRDAVAPS